MADAPAVRIIKYDAGSPTDKTLTNLQVKLAASTMVEAMRRGLTIADKITDYAKDSKIFVQSADGKLHELLIS